MSEGSIALSAQAIAVEAELSEIALNVTFYHCKLTVTRELERSTQERLIHTFVSVTVEQNLSQNKVYIWCVDLGRVTKVRGATCY